MSGSTTPMVCGNTTYPSKPYSVADAYTRSSTTAKYATLHPVYLNCSNPVFHWVNATTGGSSEDIVGMDTTRIKASVKVSGVTYPLTFNSGATDATILPGHLQASDPVSVSLTSGTNIIVYTWVEAAHAGAWPAGHTIGFNVSDGQGWYAGAPEETTVTSAGIQSSDLSGAGIPYCYSPFAITATRPFATRSVAIVGDSIASTVDSDGNKAFIVRALQGANIPYTKLAISGDSFYNLERTWWDIRLQCMALSSDVVCELGVNDILRGETLTTLKAWSLIGWQKLKDAVGGTVYQTTITPTVEHIDVRLGYNQWVRDGAPMVSGVGVATGSTDPAAVRAGDDTHPLTGYIEVADACETSRDSNLWNAYDSGDHVHPSGAGVTAMAALFDTGKFLPLVDYENPTYDTSALLAEVRGVVAYV